MNIFAPRWEVRATDRPDTTAPGLAEIYNRSPHRMFLFRHTAKRSAAFYTKADTLCQFTFTVVRIERRA